MKRLSVAWFTRSAPVAIADPELLRQDRRHPESQPDNDTAFLFVIVPGCSSK